MNRDRHIVIEARRNFNGLWTYRALTPALSWIGAQEVWDRYDEHRRNQSFPRPMNEHYYMVRADDDPNWAWLVRPKLRKSKLSSRSKVAAGQEYGKSQGVFGDTGGWLRRTGQEEISICQGWASYAHIANVNGRIRLDPETNLWYAAEAQPLLRAPLPMAGVA